MKRLLFVLIFVCSFAFVVAQPNKDQVTYAVAEYYKSFDDDSEGGDQTRLDSLKVLETKPLLADSYRVKTLVNYTIYNGSAFPASIKNEVLFFKFRLKADALSDDDDAWTVVK